MENKNELYYPIQQDGTTPEDVKRLQKDSENKIYIVLYYNLDDEVFKFKKFKGRYDTYFGIKDIIDSEVIDISNSEVLVETVGIDPNTNKARRYMMHPDDSYSILDFCHYASQFFGDRAYNIDDYTDSNEDDVDSIKEDIANFRGFRSPLLEDIENNKGMPIFITSPLILEDDDDNKNEV